MCCCSGGLCGTNAARLLAKYRDRLCTFNDDIQGTAAVVLATVAGGDEGVGGFAAGAENWDFGFGSAGIGIANLLVKALQERGTDGTGGARRIYAMGAGAAGEGAEGIHPEQMEYVRPAKDVAGWKVGDAKKIGLEEVVRNAKVTVLIGVAAKAGCLRRMRFARWRRMRSGR